MRAGLAGSLKTHSFKKINCAVEADYLQSQRFSFAVGARLELTEQHAADPAISERRQQRKINATNLVLTRVDQQAARALTVAPDYFIARVLVIAGMKILLRFILHAEEFANAIFVPV